MSIENRLSDCTRCHHIRKLFNQDFALIVNPEMAKAFYDRIDVIQKICIDQSEIMSLENLKEDIELEAEFGAMRIQKLAYGRILKLKRIQELLIRVQNRIINLEKKNA